MEQFLPFVVNYSSDAQIVVVDNASTDGSVEFLEKNYPQVERILISENKGFCGGYNYALQRIEAEYFVLLNSDVEVTPNWLIPLEKWMDTHLEVAACQPKIRAFHQKEDFEFAGAAGGFIDFLGYPFCRGRIFDVIERDSGQYDAPVSVFWATGACLFIRAKVYHELGGLDEAFFAHFEEIDLCWRIKNKGLKLYCCPESIVYHVGGGTLSKSNPRKTFFNFRNSLFMLFKNLPSSQVFLVVFSRLCLDGIAGIRFVLKGDFQNCWAVIKSHFSFYAHIPYLRSQRKKCPPHHFDFPEVYQKSIVFQHFLAKKDRFSDLEF
ncbi:MAG: glycosyltransferase family 2 protein [Flammeovirgaceae bacterium]